ncbi:hypothetical protein TGAM01_v203470 [Trichoderma gamsii]|uniref:Uncharacterized protein n=1 Tax=Trichoderma gamsii TaxID=398673 RepID=A0A2P4ZTX2_9HYPO|nr:hypothetical protein TGAM01_v203470 [Trichoderma gamsii]PON27703.1 hypothetical protein TGAM01_v203470 [Trichoderma gamsii]
MACTRINPCPNPGIPPVSIELRDIPSTTQPGFALALRVLEGYWRQATNMSTEEQWDYKSFIENSYFFRHDEGGKEIDSPENHILFNELHVTPTWGRYVFLKSLFGEEFTSIIDYFAIDIFESVETLDLEDEYRTYHRDPNRPYSETSREVQTPYTAPSDSSLPNSNSTEYLSTNRDQSNIPSPLGQSSSVNNQLLMQRDLKRLEARLKASIVEMGNKILEEVYELREHVMAAEANNDQMSSIETN